MKGVELSELQLAPELRGQARVFPKERGEVTLVLESGAEGYLDEREVTAPE